MKSNLLKEFLVIMCLGIFYANNAFSQGMGIGIAVPVSVLHVYENTANVDATTGLTVEQDGTGDAVLQYLLTGGQRWVTGIDNSDGDKFKIRPAVDLGSSALGLSILTTGEVGIGTAGPNYMLDINTDVNADGIKVGAGSGAGPQSSANIYIYPSSPNPAQRNWLISTFYDDFGTLSFRNSNAALGNPYTTGTTRMVIDAAGDVGIGITDPLTSLHVNGAISAVPFSGVAGAAITIPTNVSVFRITDDGAAAANAVSVTAPQEGQYLTILNNDAEAATFPTVSTVIPAAAGVGLFQYINGFWNVLSIASSTGVVTRWDQLLDPIGDLTLSHGTNATVFNFANDVGNALDMNATALTTGDLLSLSSSNAAAIGRTLYVTSNSTGAAASGIVHFDFTGAGRTGSGFLVDDITQAGTTMQLNVNTLTTGLGFQIGNSGTTLTTAGANTGSLFDVRTTGNVAAFTGSLANVAMTHGTGFAANTGSLVNINDPATANLTKLLTMNSGSTSNTTNILSLTTAVAGAITPANGIARFNFAGNRTAAGAGFQIDDASTTLATAMLLNANSLTTGNALAVSATAAGLTGNALSVTTGSTGIPANGLVRFNFNGARTAAGNAFQIDDISTTLATTMQLNANSLTTGNALAVSATAAGLTGNALSVTTGSTGIPANGLVRFNFNGIRTAAGNAFQIDDISTTLATTMKINSNSLTTGTGLDIDVNGLTSGMGADISSTSVAGVATYALPSKLLNLSSSGATALADHYNYGIYASVTNTDAAAAGITNTAGFFTASGANGTTSANYDIRATKASGASIMLSREDASTSSGDLLGELVFDDIDGTSTLNGGMSTGVAGLNDGAAAIRAYADEDHGNGDKGGRLSFWTKTNDLDANQASVERMRIENDGRVGINETNPGTVVHITGGVDPTNQILRIEAGAGQSGDFFEIQDDAGNDVITFSATGGDLQNVIFNEQGTDVDFRIESDNNANIFFTDGGNDRVGIGSAAPTALLDIDGIDKDDDLLVIQAATNAGGQDAEFLRILDENGVDVITFNANNGDLSGVVFNEASTDADFRIEGNGNANLFFTDAGNDRVGIGTNAPGGLFELSADQGRKPATNTWTIASDERLKNITGDYSKGLKEILQLQPITYYYKNVGERKFSGDVLNKLNVGFSAQEVSKIFPEAVGVDDDGYLNFNMHSILVAYINAIKEQQKTIEAQQKTIEAQHVEMKGLGTQIAEMKKENSIKFKQLEQLLVKDPAFKLTATPSLLTHQK